MLQDSCHRMSCRIPISFPPCFSVYTVVTLCLAGFLPLPFLFWRIKYLPMSFQPKCLQDIICGNHDGACTENHEICPMTSAKCVQRLSVLCHWSWYVQVNTIICYCLSIELLGLQNCETAQSSNKEHHHEKHRRHQNKPLFFTFFFFLLFFGGVVVDEWLGFNFWQSLLLTMVDDDDWWCWRRRRWWWRWCEVVIFSGSVKSCFRGSSHSQHVTCRVVTCRRIIFFL